MHKIKNYIYHIKEELCSAMDYAENYIEYKSSNPTWARTYFEMSEQELAHAEHLKDIYAKKIESFAWVSEEDKEEWEKCMNKYSEKEALVKLMLSK